jgi:hypothetical protein
VSSRSAVVSKNQAFTRFLPGAVETIDGETVKVTLHELRGADFDPYTRDYLRHQLKSVIEQWPHRDAIFKGFVDDPESKAFEFVMSVRLVAHALPIVECRRCGAVTNVTNDRQESKRCRLCGGGLRVVPFIEIHGCGVESNVRVPTCPNQHGDQYIKLERYAQRRWACGVEGCGWSEPAFASFCGKNCYFALLQVPIDPKKRRKTQVPVGTSSVYRTQSIDILNPPQGELVRLFRSFGEYAPALFLSDYFGLQPIDFGDLERTFQLLMELKSGPAEGGSSGGDPLEAIIANMKISDEDRAKLLAAAAKQNPGQSQTAKRVADFRASMKRTEDLLPELESATIPWKVLKELYDLRLALNLPTATTLPALVTRLSGRKGAAAVSALELKEVVSDLSRYGLEDIALISNFPIVSCAYGFTRGPSYEREDHVLRSFLKRPSVSGGSTDRTPFYVLSTGTEALVLRLSPAAVMEHMAANGFIPASEIPTDEAAKRAWVTKQFMDDDFSVNPVAYAIYTTLHSYAHRMIQQVALESCFSTTSLSEMVMPSTLSFIVYVNQRSEFNIGGLSSFVEQRLSRSLAAILQPTPCMFDPICTMKDGGACNGCLYLPEVTCREFNAGLTRSVLHGGQILAQHEVGVKIGACTRFIGFFESAMQKTAAT